MKDPRFDQLIQLNEQLQDCDSSEDCYDELLERVRQLATELYTC